MALLCGCLARGIGLASLAAFGAALYGLWWAWFHFFTRWPWCAMEAAKNLREAEARTVTVAETHAALALEHLSKIPACLRSAYLEWAMAKLLRADAKEQDAVDAAADRRAAAREMVAKMQGAQAKRPARTVTKMRKGAEP